MVHSSAGEDEVDYGLQVRQRQHEAEQYGEEDDEEEEMKSEDSSQQHKLEGGVKTSMNDEIDTSNNMDHGYMHWHQPKQQIG